MRRSLRVVCLLAAALLLALSGASPLRPALRRHLQTAPDAASCSAAVTNSPFASTLQSLPDVAGLRGCVALNLGNLTTAMAGPNAKCTLANLLELSSGTGLSTFSELAGALFSGFAAPNASSAASLSTVLDSWTKDATKSTAFCKSMNDRIGPCVETLLPVFVGLMEKKAPCCGQLGTYLEVLKLVQPNGKTTLQMLYDVVNGLHLSLCSTTGSESTLCAQPLLSFLADRVKTTGESSLLSALLFTAGVPLYALPDDSKAACAGLDTGKLPSRVTTMDGGGTTAYAALSCCATGYAALMESFDALLRQLTGNTMAETLNLITGLQADKTRQFKTPYATIKSCSFKETCAKPAYTLPADSAKPVEGDSKAKTARPSEITCKNVELCDADKVCSTVCEPGSVKIAPWVARAISHQRNLSYDQPLCWTQLPGSHNSATTLAKGYGNRDQLMNRVLDPSNAASFMRTNNQFVSITDQLNMGARFVELDVHYFAKMLHAGHCSRIDFAFLDDVSKSIVRSAEGLISAGSLSDVSVLIEWQSSLFGCLPSLSGIRAEEQQPLADVLKEVATWVKAHPNDVLLLYADMGSEIEAFSKLDAVLELYKSTFGDLLFTPASLKTMPDGSWKKFKLSELVKSGQRVVLLSTPGANDLMFDLRKLCDGFKDIPSGSPGTAGAIWGQKTNSGTLVRAYHSALHYATLSEDAVGGGGVNGTASEPAVVDPKTLPVFVNAGVNILAPDSLDGAAMRAMVWSWAPREPSTGDTAVEISAKDGRWSGVADKASIKNVACVSTSDRLAWKIVAQGASCPSGFEWGAPKLAVENVALTAALSAASGASATAQLNVDLSTFPVIPAGEDDAFEAAAGGSGGNGGGTGGDNSSGPNKSAASEVSSAVASLALALVALSVY
ncbi:hypothetical protein P43SY_007747 [Pythium insidiosum]|uniref:PLC-like phosphodiesterase n=1 Tax=Pythium insidiosum TaxID=114742 RepID=A0AAD5LYA5_PYTIN|nr:hypothetical protein P43SY_007747 [Pythium insidiosum]